MTPMPTLPALPVAPLPATEARPQPTPRDPRRDAGAEAEGPRGFARALGAARGDAAAAAPGRRAASGDAADEAEGPTRTSRPGSAKARREADADGTPPTDGMAVAPEPPPMRWPWQATARLAGAVPGADAASAGEVRPAGADGGDTLLAGASTAAATLPKPGQASPALRQSSASERRSEPASGPAGRPGAGSALPPELAASTAPGAETRAAVALRTDDGSPRFAATLAAALPAAVSAPGLTPHAGTSAAAPAEATLAASPGSAGFAAELSARLTTFVRDGIEQARLHLNPADMGPVEVRIALDGDAARVMMSAEQAPTRQWLEQALPTLAGSLREAGLTLAGGGVFEHPGGRQGQGEPSPAPRGEDRAAGDAAAPGAPAPVAATRSRGVVDLVA